MDPISAGCTDCCALNVREGLAGSHKNPAMHMEDSKQRNHPCCRSTGDAFIVRVVINSHGAQRVRMLDEKLGFYEVQLGQLNRGVWYIYLLVPEPRN